MDNKKDSLLKEFILELAATYFSDENDTKIKLYVRKLHDIYDKKYRHFYSSIFASISQNSEEKNSNLAQNIEYICHFIQNDKNETNHDFKKSVEKLYDHINLEVSHCSFFLGMANKTSMDKRIEELQSNIGNVKEKLEKTQAEYITILGVFTGIVVTVVAALIFSSSVLENINTVSFPLLIFSVSAISLFIVHILIFLFIFISSIARIKYHTIFFVIYGVFMAITLALMAYSFIRLHNV